MLEGAGVKEQSGRTENEEDKNIKREMSKQRVSMRGTTEATALVQKQMSFGLSPYAWFSTGGVSCFPILKFQLMFIPLHLNSLHKKKNTSTCYDVQ